MERNVLRFYALHYVRAPRHYMTWPIILYCDAARDERIIILASTFQMSCTDTPFNEIVRVKRHSFFFLSVRCLSDFVISFYLELYKKQIFQN